MAQRLIAYFSRAGENDVGGKKAFLTKGNTEIAAEFIHAETGGDVYRIESAIAYPEGYRDTCTLSSRELKENARPALKAAPPDPAAYQEILLLYPNWYGTMPMPVWTYLESGDFSGKRILPLCTNEGSGLGCSVKDIQKLCPASEISEGLSLRGHAVADSTAAITDWLRRTGIQA